jgi:hypothetical protein
MWRSLQHRRSAFLAVALTTILGQSQVIAQVPNDPFKAVEPVRMPLDKSGVWTLHFSYLPPRIASVDTPSGKKNAWYMVYKVWNTSDTPVEFTPTFELVTKDGELRSFLDDLQPMVFKQVRRIEDTSISDKNPEGELKIQSSVSISEKKIPVTRVDSVPRAVYGVAIWLDVAEKAPTTNNFSIYVGGLSNGVAVTESDGGQETVTQKTLQLDFFRPTDNARPGQNDIRPNDNGGLGEWQWVYRAAPARKAAAAAPEKKGETELKKDDK